MRGLVEDAISISAQDIGKALRDTADYGLVELEISGIGIQEVEIVSTPGNFGGFLRWFICPGCKRRMGKLYMPRRVHVFLCRRCHRLGYKQQLLRAFRKTQYDKKIKSKCDKKRNEKLNVLRKLIEMLKAEKRMK